MKKVVFLGILICFWQASASATTRTAASCSVADIQTQVNLSTDGDTVLVPGGSSTWTTTLTINVGLTLNGQGCTVTWPGSAPFGYLVVNAGTVTNTFITGFTFDGAYAQQGACGGPIRLVSAAGTMPYRFYNNTINPAIGGVGGSNIVVVCPTGLGPGLIDHNTFSGNITGEWVQIWGTGASFSDSTTWETDIVPGGPNFVFLEDNTVTNTSTTGVTGFIASYYGAKWVARHNHLTFANFDAHASNSSGVGVRWAEIYDNDITLPSSTDTCWGAFSTMRGGSGMVWGNTVNNSLGNCSNGPSMVLGPSSGSSDLQTGNWPLPYQAGRGIESPVGTYNYSPYYSWGNSTSLGTNNCSSLGGLCPNDTPYAEIGSSPTSSLCTANATISHPANVCDGVEFGPSASAPPSFERCESAADVTAGCPVSYTYTPYTYPHPLQNEGSASIEPPSNLQASVQ
jgi:hypothetical protein